MNILHLIRTKIPIQPPVRETGGKNIGIISPRDIDRFCCPLGLITHKDYPTLQEFKRIYQDFPDYEIRDLMLMWDLGGPEERIFIMKEIWK